MSLQMTELHYDTKPRLDATAIAARAEEILASGVEAPNLGEGTLLFSHTKFPVEYEDGTAPAQTAVLEAGRTSDIEKYTNALRQSWHCENAEELLSRSQYTVAVTEMLTRSLDPAERLREIIRKAGAAGMTKSELTRASHWLRARSATRYSFVPGEICRRRGERMPESSIVRSHPGRSRTDRISGLATGMTILSKT